MAVPADTSRLCACAIAAVRPRCLASGPIGFGSPGVCSPKSWLGCQSGGWLPRIRDELGIGARQRCLATPHQVLPRELRLAEDGLRRTEVARGLVDTSAGRCRACRCPRGLASPELTRVWSVSQTRGGDRHNPDREERRRAGSVQAGYHQLRPAQLRDERRLSRNWRFGSVT